MDFKRTASRLTACLLLAGALITPALAATGTVDTGNSILRLRTEASTEGAVLKKLTNNTQVEVLEILDNGWCRVSCDGVTGYVSGKYLAIDQEEAETDGDDAPEDESAQAAAQADEAGGEDALYVRVTTSVLNIRSGPSTDNDKTGSLRAGRVVQVLEAQASASKGQEIADYALQFVGYRYVHGGASPKGFDCSGLTTYVYKQFGYTLNRTCSGQLDNGTPVSMSELQPGDIVIFRKGSSSKRATHVGLYIGNNQFVHASTPTKGVIISKMSDSYYTKGFVGARRIV